MVAVSRTDTTALTLAANYLQQVAAIRGDGAFVDAWDSSIINFDSNALYASMGLLAAYKVLGNRGYLNAVRDFLTWFAGMQTSDPGNPFHDGAWNIGYEVNPSPPPTYRPALGPYAAQGISEIKWVDAVQCLPAFLLWWYWKLSGDETTKDALLPKYRKAVEGFLANNYDPKTGFYFSSWQNKTGPTIFLYHDAVRRVNAGGVLLELHNDAEEDFFTYSGTWSSYAPQGAVHSDEHFTLTSQDFVEFSLGLAAGDQVQWITQTGWDTGIAEILVSTDGIHFQSTKSVDGYSQALLLQQAFVIYTAPSPGTYRFRIRHSGTINPAGNRAAGWQRLANRFTAGQTDVALGLTALWLLTREVRYARLAARLIRRFPGRFWSETDGRWVISRDGPAPGGGNNFWYPMTHGYTVFGQKQSRFFQPVRRFAEGLQALEPYQDAEGGFQPPGYIEPQYIFSAFYCLGENQLAAPTSAAQFNLAKEFLKSGQYLLELGGQPTGGIPFSKRYQYLYTNIAGFACLALAGIQNPIRNNCGSANRGWCNRNDHRPQKRGGQFLSAGTSGGCTFAKKRAGDVPRSFRSDWPKYFLTSNSRRAPLLDALGDPSPFFLGPPTELRRRAVDDRELIAPFPGTGGINDGAGIHHLPGLLVLGRNARVERRGPGARDDVDAGGRIGTSRNGPHQLFEIGHVNIVIHNDDVAAGIGPDVAHGRDVTRLPGVAGIELLDGDSDQHARAAGFMAPGLRDARHAGLGHLLLQERRALDGAEALLLVRGNLGREAADNGVVAEIDGFDVQEGFFAGAAGVVAGPLAEGTLDFLGILVHKTFKDDFGVGRHGQTGEAALDDRIGRAANAADPVILADPVGQLRAGREQHERVAANDDERRDGFVPGPVFLAVDTAVLSWRDIEANRLFVHGHDR